MPGPVLFVIAMLVGWPLVQLGSSLLARGPRRRMRDLAADLRRDPRLDPADHALIERVVRQSSASYALVAAPLVAPLVILAASGAALLGRFTVRDGRGDREAAALTAKLGDLKARIAAAEVRLGERTGSETVERDPRFHALSDTADEIALIRQPVSVALIVLSSLPVLPFFMLAFGLHAGLSLLPRLALACARVLDLTSVGPVPFARN